MLDPFSQDKNDNSESKILINKFIPYNSTKMKNQHKIIINNIEIFFPFPPHETQIIYMKKIIQNLTTKFESKENYKAIAALESPKGTGKTQCLLCATLAWLKHMRTNNNYKGKIIYTAKSYNKISNIIKELNKIYYKPKISILFSPYDACINNNVNISKNDKIIHMKCKNEYNNCEFYKNYEKYEKENNDCINNNDEDYLDVEDLEKFVCHRKICPFYYEKNNMQNSDIIFMPYEFLFDKQMIKILGININDNILIIDESHNLPKLCQDINTICVNTNDLDDIIQELYKFMKAKKTELTVNRNYKITTNDINSEILSINKVINNINSNSFHILQGEVYPGKGLILSNKDFLSLFLTKNNPSKNNNNNDNNSNNNNVLNYEIITLDNIKKHIHLLKRIQKLIYINFEKNTKLPLYIAVLEKIYNFYINHNDKGIDSYIFFLSYIKNEEANNSNHNKIRKLTILCFDPSISLKKIIEEKPYAIFLTSDTLTPFDILENEFKLKFDIKLENEHIIQNDQFKFSIIQSSLYNAEKISFQLDYLHRSNVKMNIALGYTLLSLCYTNKFGSILVYFPSMTYLNQCNLIWKDNKIIDNLQSINNIYYSQKNLKKLKKLKNDKNYIFFVVFDKNTSPEEIFFRESNITMVVCLGIPYDTEYSYDDKMQLKIKYLDDKIKNNLHNNYNNYYNIDNELSGEKWYKNNFISIINRFLGKSLKLLSGYGSLICIDERYESFLNMGHFSSYLKKNCEIINIEDTSYFNSLGSFFEEIRYKISKNFGFFGNASDTLNINYEKNGKKIQYIEEDEDTENYYINKKYNNKIFELQNKTDKIIDDLLNDSEKLEDLIFHPKKLNKYLDSKRKNNDLTDNDFLQKKINKNKDESIDDENNNNTQNKKVKIEDDYHNRNTTFKNNNNNYNLSNHENYIYDGSNTYKNLCEEYDNKNINIVNNVNNTNILNNENNEENKHINNNNENINEDNEYLNEESFEPNTDILEQLNNNTFTATSKEVYDCPICFKTSSKNPDLIYSISKCRHVLCNVCWSGWLAEKLECPLCKGKARAKTLKRLIFIK